MCSQNFNRKLLLENRRCKAAKKKFACMPAGSYKLISLVQAKFSVSLHRSRLACYVVLRCQCGLVDIYQQPINGQKNKKPGLQ